MVEDPGPEGLYKGSRAGGWWKCGVHAHCLHHRWRDAAWGLNHRREAGGGGVWGPEPCT